MTVGELGERMTAAELAEWHDYDAGRHSDELVHAASIVAAIYNATPFNKKRFKVEDFLPELDAGPKAPPTTDELKAKMAARRERHNAFVLRRAQPTFGALAAPSA